MIAMRAYGGIGGDATVAVITADAMDAERLVRAAHRTNACRGGQAFAAIGTAYAGHGHAYIVIKEERRYKSPRSSLFDPFLRG